MKERPILFKAPMVRAILDGNKVQTRRIVKSFPAPPHGTDPDALVDCVKDLDGAPTRVDVLPDDSELCPYGVTGDRLWVKETWAVSAQWDGIRPLDIPDTTPIHYLEDEPLWPGRCRPSIFMRRWMSRITLEVTGVRVERLQDISEDDAKAEGVAPLPLQSGQAGCQWTADVSAGFQLHGITPSAAFRRLWNSINGAESWNANPWVWVVSFRKVDGNG